MEQSANEFLERGKPRKVEIKQKETRRKDSFYRVAHRVEIGKESSVSHEIVWRRTDIDQPVSTLVSILPFLSVSAPCPIRIGMECVLPYFFPGGGGRRDSYGRDRAG